jgi:hypothetical protein
MQRPWASKRSKQRLAVPGAKSHLFQKRGGLHVKNAVLSGELPHELLVALPN